ncbi:MAG: O-methyltransferase [Phycisphaerae bacterium]
MRPLHPVTRAPRLLYPRPMDHANPARLWTDVDAYFADHLIGPDPVLEEVLRSADRAGLPAIHVSPAQGRLLNILAASINARRILEIGTLAGYSTICLARALPPAGRITTIESVPLHAQIARRNFQNAGIADRVDLREGLALDVLAKVEAAGHDPFDLVFIDADKQNIPAYFEVSIRLTRPGGLIIVDNVVRDGSVIDASSTDPNVQGVRRFVDAASHDPRIRMTVTQTVGAKGYDGFALAHVLG